MSTDCNNLDAYLAADLPAENAAQFAEHLQRCDNCRDAADEQRWIDGLLRSSATNAAELPPDDVLISLRTSITRHRQRTKLFACGLAAAAALVVAVGWIELNRQASDQTGEGVVRPSLAANENAHAKQPPRATFVSNSNAIAVPMESRHSDVTIVRIYPTYRPHYENQTAAIEPEAAATNENWNVYSNGG